MSKWKRDRVRKLDQNIQERKGEGVKILDANSVFYLFFYSLVCLRERQRSEMEKCHLASIRLPLSSPCRSERWGEGLLKRVLKGCEPPFAFEIIPSLIFISTEHVKHVLTLWRKKKKRSLRFPWSWTLKFLQLKAGQIAEFLVDGEMWSCSLACP